MKNPDGLRGQVYKYLPLFTGYVQQYGSAVVREVLTNGKSGKLRLKVCLNRKDRMQMIQMLDL
jgi:hypothetical protein